MSGVRRAACPATFEQRGRSSSGRRRPWPEQQQAMAAMARLRRATHRCLLLRWSPELPTPTEDGGGSLALGAERSSPVRGARGGVRRGAERRRLGGSGTASLARGGHAGVRRGAAAAGSGQGGEEEGGEAGVRRGAAGADSDEGRPGQTPTRGGQGGLRRGAAAHGRGGTLLWRRRSKEPAWSPGRRVVLAGAGARRRYVRSCAAPALL